MRKYINAYDDTIEKWADDISGRFCARSYRGGCSYDWSRPATAEERAVLRPIIIGALNALNWGEEIRREGTYGPGVSAVLNSAEFIGISAMRRFTRGGEEYQSYNGIYCPLMRCLHDWPTV